ncbi:MAG: AraC family transcriptional regulator [Aquabacterium sp.]|nr:MAG: AraC family transcriptional regulator [Aquabacterium sp.]
MLQPLCNHPEPFGVAVFKPERSGMAIKSFTLSQIAWYRTMSDAFRQRGLNADDLLAKSGVPIGPTDEMDVHHLSDLFSGMWEQAVARTNDPGIGLTRVGHPLAAFGVVSHMLLSSTNVLAAAKCLSRFAALVSPTFSMDVVHEDKVYVVSFAISGGRRPVPMQRFDFLASVFLAGAQWITGKRLVPNVMYMPFPEPADTTPWRDAYGCHVEFNASSFRGEFKACDFEQAIPTSDPAIADMCVRMTEQAAQELGEHFTGKVRQMLTKILHKGDPRREQVAEMLCISERTLQRRLSEEGTSFAELVDAVRRERAERMLARGYLSVTEMACELGFSDPSNFYRACKRWFGLSPSSLRVTQ